MVMGRFCTGLGRSSLAALIARLIAGVKICNVTPISNHLDLTYPTQIARYRISPEPTVMNEVCGEAQ
jgi:hypothetical protein